jgi:hypothetical protein
MNNILYLPIQKRRIDPGHDMVSVVMRWQILAVVVGVAIGVPVYLAQPWFR